MSVVFEGRPIAISLTIRRKRIEPLAEEYCAVAGDPYLCDGLPSFQSAEDRPDGDHLQRIFGCVDKTQVTEVTIQGDNISGRLTNGTAFKTYAPRDAGASRC